MVAERESLSKLAGLGRGVKCQATINFASLPSPQTFQLLQLAAAPVLSPSPFLVGVRFDVVASASASR